jgi:hypothetical protein
MNPNHLYQYGPSQLRCFVSLVMSIALICTCTTFVESRQIDILIFMDLAVDLPNSTTNSFENFVVPFVLFLLALLSIRSLSLPVVSSSTRQLYAHGDSFELRQLLQTVPCAGRLG